MRQAASSRTRIALARPTLGRGRRETASEAAAEVKGIRRAGGLERAVRRALGLALLSSLAVTPASAQKVDRRIDDPRRTKAEEQRFIDLSSRAEEDDLAAARAATQTFQPPSLDLSSGVAPFDPAKMATCIERSMFDAGVVGYSYAIVRLGKLEKSGSHGWARAPWEAESPAHSMHQNSRMTVASISKTVTAVAVMRLVQENELSLDDPFYPIIEDEFPNAGDGVDGITIRQLLSHTSGLTPASCSKMAESIAAPASGNGFAYRNLNYCILRKVIEHVTGEDYVDHVQHEILEPMGITSMSCAETGDEPTLYYNTTEGQAGKLWPDYTESCGAFGWYASAIDLAKFLAHFRYDTVLSPAMASQMLTDCPSAGYCLGWQRLSGSQGTYYSHGGDWIASNGRGFTGSIMHFNFDIDAVLLVNTRGAFNKTAVLRDAYDRAFGNGCVPPPPPPKPQAPTTCPDTGCGTKENGPCATVGTYPDGSKTPLSKEPFIPQNNPDGAAAFNQYCEDFPKISDYVENAPQVEMVCAEAVLPQGTFDICKSCADGAPWPGCECQPAHPDSCGPGLTCFESTGYAEDRSVSTHRCWDTDDGPPRWECEADCHAIYGDSGYCHHGAQPWEGAGAPICASTYCELGGVVCAQNGQFCNTDTGECEVECNGETHDPGLNLFSCQGRGYPAQYNCHLDSHRCFIAGVWHP